MREVTRPRPAPCFPQLKHVLDASHSPATSNCPPTTPKSSLIQLSYQIPDIPPTLPGHCKISDAVHFSRHLINMAPTESAILDNFLLAPSQLPAIITPHDFTALFPRPQQSSSQIRTLYRDLQTQRNAVVDTVAANIQTEAKRSKGLRRAVVRARRQAESQDYDQEIEIERSVWLCTSHNDTCLHLS